MLVLPLDIWELIFDNDTSWYRRPFQFALFMGVRQAPMNLCGSKCNFFCIQGFSLVRKSPRLEVCTEVLHTRWFGPVWFCASDFLDDGLTSSEAHADQTCCLGYKCRRCWAGAHIRFLILALSVHGEGQLAFWRAVRCACLSQCGRVSF